MKRSCVVGKCVVWKKLFHPKNRKLWLTIFVLALLVVDAYAQTGGDGKKGIQEAETRVKSYFDVGTQLVYGIGSVAGLVGAVKVYNKWNQGDQDTSKVAASWFGSCIFLVVVATVLRAFFL